MRSTHALLFFIFAALSLVLFYPSLHGEFIMDDWGYITENAWVTNASSPWRYWATFEQTDYWPLTYTCYWFFFKVFGASPLGYHLINIAMHALNGVLLFTLAQRFRVRWPLWVALLFLLHPLHAQAVAWIVQFKTLLSTALALVTLISCHENLEGGGRRYLWMAFAAFALALLSKTSVVFLPFVLLAMAWDLPGRERIKLVTPFFALAALGGFATVYVNELNFHDRQGDVFNMSLAERAITMIQNLIFYPKTFFWPLDLSYMYPMKLPEIYGQGLYLLPAGVLIWTLIAAVIFYKPWRPYRFFILSYLFLLLPCLGLVAIPNMKLSLVADHWAYLPDVFLALFLGKLLWRLDDVQWRTAFLAPLVLLGGLTFRHAATFASEEAFWARARAVNPHHAAPYYNLGVVYGKQARNDESIDQYRKAIQRDLTHYRAWFNLGRAFFLKQEYEKAEECFLHSVKLNPKMVSGYLALASTYQKVGRRENAVKVVEKGLVENPGNQDLVARLKEFKN